MNWWILASPFLLAGAVLALLKGCKLFSAWRIQCAIDKRNAKLASYSITPFRGVKEHVYDDQH